MTGKLQSKCAAVALTIGLLISGGMMASAAWAADVGDQDTEGTSGVVFYIDNSTGVYYPSILSATSWMLENAAGKIKSGLLQMQVNGKQFALESYQIDENNYIKLRDLAYLLNGTTKQFDVSWDNVAHAIVLTTNRAYTPIGGELTVGKNKPKVAVRNAAPIVWNTLPVDIRTYNMDGTTYVKLRDVARILNYYIGWDAKQQLLVIDTNRLYPKD